MLFTVKSLLVPTSGIGAKRGGTTAGGKMVILIMSPVFIMKSAGMRSPLYMALMRKNSIFCYIKIMTEVLRFLTYGR
jgi:hypothetical protein